MNIGAFVEVTTPPHREWGVGKIIQVSGNSAAVQYFSAPGVTQPDAVRCSVTSIRRVKIPSQTRAWRRHSSGRWQVGRVIADEGSSLFIQFPNGQPINIDISDVYIRWNLPLIDPLPLLCAEATESPFLADPRSAFVREVTRQRIASSGVTALMSSSVELESYQFDVIRRVLTDPIQRYLLADEVGLGKTIEAGVIIRQHFLDDDHARAVVVVPPTLVNQWRGELGRRFGLEHALDDFLHVVRSDDLEHLEEVVDDAGLLVVDEAHHLSRWTTDAERRLFEILRVHAQQVPKLLLLSATPVLADEEGFLRVLHLLDPVLFPLNDLEGFRRRIASRELVAEIAAGLVPENLWGLTPELDRLEAAYGDDPALSARIAALRSVLDTLPAEDDDQYLAALQELRTHLLESYRLHRRMLRHRRTAIPWASIGRNGAGLATLNSAAAVRYAQCWEDLRLVLSAEDALSDALCLQLLQAAGHGRGRISIRQLLADHGITQSEIVRLAAATDQAADRWREDRARFNTLIETVTDLLRTPGCQMVVFCDDPSDADRATEALRSAVPSGVERHVPPARQSSDPQTETWERFLTEPGQVRVLVCDHRAEEGVNLHGGRKIAVHFDLPVAPNRIEQRLGRLDRYGKGDPVRSIVLVDEGSDLESLWAEIILEGWQVCNRSVASLQYLIESAMRGLAREWLNHGPSALASHQDALDGDTGLVSTEMRQIDRQDALDALAESDQASMDELEDCDHDWSTWRSAFRGYAFNVLLFHERPLPGPPTAGDDRRFRVGYAHRDHDRPTLLPMTGFLQHFLQSVDLNARGSSSRLPLSHPYVFARKSATSRQALAEQVRLLRVGDPMVTALERFSAQDDRGRAFAVWRTDRSHTAQDASGVDLFFRFDFIARARPLVDAVPATSSPSAELAALTRKAEQFLPPTFVRVWVDGNGNVVEDPGPLLTAAYSDTWVGTRRDFNLNPSRWRALPAHVREGWMRNWADLCQARRHQAEDVATRHPTLVRQRDVAIRAVDLEAARVAAQTASRLLRLSGSIRQHESQSLAREQSLRQILRDAVANPALQLDVVGAFFVSAEPFESA